MKIRILPMDNKPFLTPWYYYRPNFVYEVTREEDGKYFVDVPVSPYAEYGATNHWVPSDMCELVTE